MSKSENEIAQTIKEDQSQQATHAETNEQLKEIKKALQTKQAKALLKATPYLSELGLPIKLSFSPILESLEKGYNLVTSIVDKINQKTKQSMTEKAQLLVARKAFAAHQLVCIIEQYNRDVSEEDRIEIGDPTALRLDIFQSAIDAHLLILETSEHAEDIKAVIGHFKSNLQALGAYITRGFKKDKKIAHETEDADEKAQATQSTEKKDHIMQEEAKAAQDAKGNAKSEMQDELMKTLLDPEGQKAYASAVNILRESTSFIEKVNSFQTYVLLDQINTQLSPKFEERKGSEYAFALRWSAFDKFKCSQYTHKYKPQSFIPDHTRMTDIMIEEISQNHFNYNRWFDLARQYASFKFVDAEDEKLSALLQQLEASPNGARSIKDTAEMIVKTKEIGSVLGEIQVKLEQKEKSAEADEQVSPIKALFVKETLKKLQHVGSQLSKKIRAMQAHERSLHPLSLDIVECISLEKQKIEALETTFHHARYTIIEKEREIELLERKKLHLETKHAAYEAFKKKPKDYQHDRISDVIEPEKVDQKDIEKVCQQLTKCNRELPSLISKKDKVSDEITAKKAILATGDNLLHYIQTGGTKQLTEKDLPRIKEPPLKRLYANYQKILGAGHEDPIEKIIAAQCQSLLERLSHLKEKILSGEEKTPTKPKISLSKFFPPRKTTLKSITVGKKKEDILNLIEKCERILSHPSERVQFNIVDCDASEHPELSKVIQMINTLKGENFIVKNINDYREQVKTLFTQVDLATTPLAATLYYFLSNQHDVNAPEQESYLQIPRHAESVYCLTLKCIQNIQSNPALMKIYHAYQKATGCVPLERQEAYIQDQLQSLKADIDILHEKIRNKASVEELFTLSKLKELVQVPSAVQNPQHEYTWGKDDKHQAASLELDGLDEVLEAHLELKTLYEQYKTITGKDPVADFLAHKSGPANLP